jgi:hypothetical protein
VEPARSLEGLDGADGGAGTPGKVEHNPGQLPADTAGASVPLEGLDETAKRAIAMHDVEGKIIRILAPLTPEARARVLAAVICLNDEDLAQDVVDTFLRKR